MSAAKSRASGKTITIPDAAVRTRPFGLNMSGPWMNDAALDNRYQYNGKELNDDFGLGWNDYGARWYERREAEPSCERIVVGLESIAPAWDNAAFNVCEFYFLNFGKDTSSTVKRPAPVPHQAHSDKVPLIAYDN